MPESELWGKTEASERKEHRHSFISSHKPVGLSLRIRLILFCVKTLLKIAEALCINPIKEDSKLGEML